MTDFISNITLISNSLFGSYLPILTNFFTTNPLTAFVGACLVFMILSRLFVRVRNRVQL